MGTHKVQEQSKLWVQAGIISQTQADEIVTFENQRGGKSWIAFGVSAVGVTAIVVGIISLIAANWDQIPPYTKLALYFVLQSCLGFACIRHAERVGVARELLFSAFALLLFGGIGLIGQIYHLESDGLSALRFWLILTFPLALAARRFLLPRIWFFIFAWTWAIWFTSDTYLHNSGAARQFMEWYRGMLLLAVAYGAIAVGQLKRHWPSSAFLHTSSAFGWLGIMGILVPLTNMLWAYKSEHIDLPVDALIAPVLVLAAAAYLYVKNNGTKKEQIAARLLALLVLTSFVLFIIPCIFDVEKSDLIGGLIFVLQFGIAAAAAALLQAKRLFDIATFILAARFVVAYFEVFGSLSLTGLGLIVSGAVILGAVYVWAKVRKRVGAYLGVEL